jgi:hypothetical protein
MNRPATDHLPGEGGSARREGVALSSLLAVLLRAALGTAVSLTTMVVLLLVFYATFVDLRGGETLRQRPYGDALLVVLWWLSAGVGGWAAGYRARQRLAPALVVGISLMVAFGLARRVFLAPHELSGPAPAMVYWILAALIPCTVAGALLAPSRGDE